MRILALALALFIAPAVASAQVPHGVPPEASSEGPVYTTVIELPFTTPPADTPATATWKSVQVEGLVRARNVPEAVHIGEPILTWLTLHKLCDATASECSLLAHVQVLDEKPDEEASLQVVRIVFMTSAGQRVEVFNLITETGLSQSAERHLANRQYWTRVNDGAWERMTDEKDRSSSYTMVRPFINLVTRLVHAGVMKVIKE